MGKPIRTFDTLDDANLTNPIILAGEALEQMRAEAPPPHRIIIGIHEHGNLAQVVYISDVMDVPIANNDYSVRSDEGIRAPGKALTSVVQGPTFEASAALDPIAKGPGGGNKPVTPTLVIRNLGPGNALDATAILFFYHISVQASDLYATPSVGALIGPTDCDEGELKCDYFVWEGDVDHREAITLTTYEGQSTINPVPYTATVVITDSLSNGATVPVSSTAGGRVT